MAAKAEDLVPLVVGRTATPEEHRQIEDAARTNGSIEDEIVFWRKVNTAVLADGNEVCPGDRGWHRLEAALDQNKAGGRQAELNQAFTKLTKVVELPRGERPRPP